MRKIMGRMAVCAAALALSACGGPAVLPLPTNDVSNVPRPSPVVRIPSSDFDRTPTAAAKGFAGVIRQMEPIVERECVRRRTTPINCDYQFVVDDRAGLEPNAFQTVGKDGRPIIGFTLSLIGEARNADELAFVVGHEASHHILGHLDRKSSAAMAGSVILGGLASAYGASEDAIRSAQDAGAQMGARYYSRDWELEADYLGAIIALDAGFDPAHGAQFFARIPDPGDRILGSHPSTASRMAQVARAVRDYQSGAFY